MQSAVASAITEMINEELIASQFSVGIYTFGNPLTHVYPTSPGQSTSTDLTADNKLPRRFRHRSFPTPRTRIFLAYMTSLAAASSAAGDGSTLRPQGRL